MIQQETIVALSTASGVGAIAVIRLSGIDSFDIVNKVFRGKDLKIQKSHTAHFGLIVENEAIIDEVVVTIFKGPQSFTKEDVVEISCHGSPYIVNKIIRLLIKNGARSANAGEFTQRAFLNGRFDLTQAEAVADLIASENELSHQLAVKQLRGGFAKEIQNLRTELIDFASLIELELDFSEEDVEFANRDHLKTNIYKILHVISPLIQSFEWGNTVKNGVPVVIVGRPNAGKSTLLNTLLNEERAIVSDIAGTTRDTIEEYFVINGLKFRLIDTAGLRDTVDTIESIGIKKAYEKINEADIVIYLYDSTQMTAKELKSDLEALTIKDQKLLVIGNKADKLTDKSKLEHTQLLLSAQVASDVEVLKNELFKIASSQKGSSDNVITNSRHYESLLKTQEALEQVLNGMELGITSDFIAMDIRLALHHLGLITGEVTTDDLLGNIFGKFCIGK
ncbi:MAG: tRNA uridine-5-carboxymethylaminomethyl(34) synthesis GTPase MnmE [Cytophagales bacterium]